jgi:hypothetical protein
MYKKSFKLRNAAKMLVTALTATTMGFASCDKPDDETPADPNASVFTAFSIMGQAAAKGVAVVIFSVRDEDKLRNASS